MDMNNLRTESHVAQKNRRHKLRFQQNSDDPTHQHFEVHRPGYGSLSYDPNVFPSEMLHSIASNPHLLLPPNHAFPDQDSGSVSVSGCSPANQQTVGNNWKTVVNPQNDWNVVTNYSNVASMNIDQTYNNDLQNSGEVPAFGCAPFYQNTLQEVVTTATVGSHDYQSKNFLDINPCLLNASPDQLGFVTNRNNEGLSLSLSSIPRGKTELKTDVLTNSDSKQLMDVSCFAHRNVGPLGPFTGYATVLKNSKYLKPAQELLSDSCKVGGDELVQTCDDTRKILEEEMGRVSGESGASPSTVYGSNEHVTGRSSSVSEPYRPEFHHKKAKLLYMQEEVWRRYKQYYQQMQMVISSFETVAGLTSATPFVCLALKSVSRHFHFVKNAISEQLTQMKKTFEDLCSPSRTFDVTTDSLSQLKSVDKNNVPAQRHHGKFSDGSGYFTNQQPIWRPQRGLPERAVAVLKAWLFDHFLHPYPSDADKHMLATQTGLTRNQVSNWFINARVRIWKPMVEEIHTLETKGLANSNPNSNNPPTDGQDTSRMDIGSMTNKPQPKCLRTTSGSLTMITTENDPNEQQWNHDKRSRLDNYHIPQPTMDRSFTNIMPYPRTAPVSLTLGLTQNAEHVQQLQQHEHQLRQRFGGI